MPEFDPARDHAAHRAVLKRTMHSMGLGLRHVRLLVDACTDVELRAVMIRTMCAGAMEKAERLVNVLD